MADLSGSQAAVHRLLGPLDGVNIEGGCAHCDAYQSIAPASAGVWLMTVLHDEGCPVLAAKKAAQS